MEHDGENLRKALEEAGMKVGYFGEQMGVGRNTPTRWFETPNLTDTRLIQVAKLLKREPSDLFPRLKKSPLVAQALPSNTVEDAPRPHYGSSADTLQKCTEERQRWQHKAYEWMEKYTMLLEQHNQLLAARLESTAKKPVEWLVQGANPLQHTADCCPVVAH